MNARAFVVPSVVAFTLASSALLSGCGTGTADTTPVAAPAPAVTASEVALREIHDWENFTGRLEAVETVEVRPRVGGFVESVNFEEGGRVAKGDLLFQIDPRPFRAEVDRLTAERSRAQAQLAVARSYGDRAERLLSQNATSQEEFERLAADAKVAAAQLASVKAALELAELNLSFTQVTAPITGRVSRAIVTAGNLVDSSAVLTTVVSDDRLYAYFDVDEQTYLTHVSGSYDGAPGTAYIGLIDETGYPHPAALDFVDNQVDPDHGTIRARAVVDNPDGRFTPGLFARIQLVSQARHRAALVDDRAIGTDLGRKFVLVIDESSVAQYRPVEIGRSVDGLRVVTEGLSDGDVVIVNGLQRVRPGTPVSATKVAMDQTVVTRLAAAEGDVETTTYGGSSAYRIE
jgi:membrane fusion protein, multidrug efflux system